MYIFNIWIDGVRVFLVFRDFTPFFGELGEYSFFLNIHLFYHYASTFLYCYMLCYYRYMPSHYHCNFYHMITPVLDICYHLVLARLTWYCDPWPDTITHDTCITGHIMIITFTGTWHDYYIITRHLVLLNSCTPELLYSCTVLMSPALWLLLIAQSDRRPAEHAWCRDDEDVSHNRASVRLFLNGTKCHTEQSATPHTWWGPPLESVGGHL